MPGNTQKPTDCNASTSHDSWVRNHYLDSAISHNTQKAYRSDIESFQSSGGRLPATPEMIVNYLQSFAANLNPRTLSRHLTALRHWHKHHHFPDPTLHPVVRKTLKGIHHVHGKGTKKAPALSPEQLQKIVQHLDRDKNKVAIRDSALLQLAFFGAFRRSELVAIFHEHVSWQELGVEVLVPHSKTDQAHEGSLCAVPYGNELLCPVRALKDWLREANISNVLFFVALTAGGIWPTKHWHHLQLMRF